MINLFFKDRIWVEISTKNGRSLQRGHHFFFCKGHPVALLNEVTTKYYLFSVNKTIYYPICTLMTTCFGNLTNLKSSLRNLLHERYLHCMLPHSKFYKDDLMMIKWSKLVVIKIEYSNILLCWVRPQTVLFSVNHSLYRTASIFLLFGEKTWD
jgi:hypothetical protein